MSNPSNIPHNSADGDDFADTFAADIRLIAAAARRFRLRHQQQAEPVDEDPFDRPNTSPPRDPHRTIPCEPAAAARQPTSA